jgi:hypothetical protein
VDPRHQRGGASCTPDAVGLRAVGVLHAHLVPIRQDLVQHEVHVERLPVLAEHGLRDVAAVHLPCGAAWGSRLRMQGPMGLRSGCVAHSKGACMTACGIRVSAVFIVSCRSGCPLAGLLTFVVSIPCTNGIPDPLQDLLPRATEQLDRVLGHAPRPKRTDVHLPRRQAASWELAASWGAGCVMDSWGSRAACMAKNSGIQETCRP